MDQETITQLRQFRVNLYHTFTRKADAMFELIDALSSDTQARSPAELSLSGSFHRQPLDGGGSRVEPIDGTGAALPGLVGHRRGLRV